MFPPKFVLTLANFSTGCSLRLLAFLFALFEQTKAKEDCKCSASLSSCQNPFGNSLTLGFLSLSPLRHDHVKKCKLPRLTAHKCLVFCFVNCKATSHLQSCPIILIFFSSIYLKWYVLKKSSSSMLPGFTIHGGQKQVLATITTRLYGLLATQVTLACEHFRLS